MVSLDPPLHLWTTPAGSSPAWHQLIDVFLLGQVQVGTTPCASITTTAVATSTLAPVSQYSDGQIQVTPAASVPTVTSVPQVTGTAVGTASGSAVTLPTETGAGGSTLVTSAVSGTSSGSAAGSSAAASGTTSSASAATSAPAQSGAAAGSVNMVGAAVALTIGLIGAVAFL